MKFSEYCDIMQTRGINELLFCYNGGEDAIEMVADNFSEFVKGAPLKVVYLVGWHAFEFDSFDELLQAKIFDDKTLEEIWSEIYDVTFNGYTEEDFILNDDGLTFAERMEIAKQEYIEENGIEQWSHTLTDKQSFWYSFQFVVIGTLILPVLLQVFPILGLATWYFELLMGGAVLITLIIAVIAMLKSPVVIHYSITNKLIRTFNGINCDTRYDNIRKVTMRKYRNKQGYGRIQIYVKKGLSLNFRMVHVPDVENVYKLIMDNLANANSGK